MIVFMLRSSLALLALAEAAFGQPAANPDAKSLAGNLRMRQAQIAGVLKSSIEKMKEENFSSKPVDTMRSFGELVSQVSESQYAFCSAAMGIKSPAAKVFGGDLTRVLARCNSTPRTCLSTPAIW